jgi:hypothetical protein
MFNHTNISGIKKVKKYIEGSVISIELFPDDLKDKRRMNEKDLVKSFDNNFKKILL